VVTLAAHVAFGGGRAVGVLIALGAMAQHRFAAKAADRALEVRTLRRSDIAAAVRQPCRRNLACRDFARQRWYRR